MSELLNSMGAAVFLAEKELMKLIRSAPRRYKVFQIPKRTPGQFRTIAQPAKEVKALQYWVIEHFLKKMKIHPAATAYVEGKNIADNASEHRQSNFLLKMDFTDFFPSLRAKDFQRYVKIKRITLEDGDAEALSRILFWRGNGTGLCLSIGAPSSPLVSNILMHEFDEKVSAYCVRRGVAYTRYADDLSFSADVSSKLGEVERFVIRVCQRLASPKLTLNPQKLVRVSKRGSRHVTGLVITNEAEVSLGRDRKRLISAGVHHYITGRLSDVQRPELRGMLAFAKSVEPKFLDRLRRKYGAETIERIQKGS